MEKGHLPFLSDTLPYFFSRLFFLLLGTPFHGRVDFTPIPKHPWFEAKRVPLDSLLPEKSTFLFSQTGRDPPSILPHPFTPLPQLFYLYPFYGPCCHLTEDPRDTNSSYQIPPSLHSFTPRIDSLRSPASPFHRSPFLSATPFSSFPSVGFNTSCSFL